VDNPKFPLRRLDEVRLLQCHPAGTLSPRAARRLAHPKSGCRDRFAEIVRGPEGDIEQSSKDRFSLRRTESKKHPFLKYNELDAPFFRRLLL
jgi:hypothetical protein